MKEIERLRVENARMRKALEEVVAELPRARHGDELSTWRVLGAIEVVVARGLGESAFVDGRLRSRQATESSSTGEKT